MGICPVLCNQLTYPSHTCDSFLEKCDGLVITSAEPYEREAIAHVTEWFAETSREVYTVGHLLPVGPNAISGESKQSEKAEEIIHFLDKILDAEGVFSW